MYGVWHTATHDIYERAACVKWLFKQIYEINVEITINIVYFALVLYVQIKPDAPAIKQQNKHSIIYMCKHIHALRIASK